MPIGNPIQKNNDTRVISATATTGQTDFTVTGGYTINAIGVFRNGVRLNNSTDFTAADGSTVSLNVACDAGDTVTFHIFDKFTVANAIVGAASTQTVYGNLAVNGELYSTNFNPTNLDVAGIGTIAKAIIGTGVTIDQSNIDTVGLISATTFTGDVTGSISGATGTFSGDITANGNIVGDNSTNISGIASVTATDFFGTVQTAAQANITSLGTLTGLTVSGDVSIADKIVHTADENTAIRFPSADTVSVETAGTERLNITASAVSASTMFKSDSFEANADLVLNSDSNANNSTNDNIIFKNAGTERVRIKGTGYTGIGTASPQEKLHLYGGNCALEVDAPVNRYCSVGFSVEGASKWWMGRGDSDILSETSFFIGKDAGNATDKGGNSAKLVIDSNGRVCVGTTVSRAVGGTTHRKILVESTDASAGIGLLRNTDNSLGSYISMGKTRGGSNGSTTVVQADDTLGIIHWLGADGTDVVSVAAEIRAQVDGSPGSDDMPGRLIFKTTADGADSPTERMRITSTGKVSINSTSPDQAVLEVQGAQAYGDSASTLATAVTKSAFRVKGSTNSSDSLWMGVEASNANPYIQASNNPGTTTRLLLLNPFGGNIGIGTITPGNALEIYGTATTVVAEVNGTGRYRGYEIHEAGTRKAYFQHDATDNCALLNTAESELKFYTGDTLRMEIDGNGRLLVGGHTTASIINAGGIESLNATGNNFGVGRFVASAVGPDIVLAKSRNATLGSHTIVQDNDLVGTIKFRGSDGGEWVDTARIHSEVDGTPGDDDMPGALVFSTTADGASSVTERMRIHSNGNVDVAGHLISSTSGAIDPDNYNNHFITGDIQDGSGWGVRGIAFGDAVGDMMAIGHNGSAGYFGMQNGSTGSMESFIKFVPNGEVDLHYNGTSCARTVECNSLKGFLVGSDTYLNDSVTHGELIVRKDLASPNDASISQCARITIITNEQTAGGNGYGGALFFGTQDVDTSNQYTTQMAGIGGSADGSDTGNAEKSGSFYIWTRNGATLSAKFKVRYDGNLYGTDTTIGSLSDNRLKENIEDFSFDLNKFKQLQPKRFNWKHPEYHGTTPSSGKHRGFIAQDLEAIDAELVDTDKIDKDNPESSLVDADGLGKTTHLGKSDAMYVSVINQLIAKIETLETKVAALESA